MAKQNFPGPYLNDTIEEDSMMVRRPANHMEIASRKSLLSNTHSKSTLMNIEHVGDQNNHSTRRGDR